MGKVKSPRLGLEPMTAGIPGGLSISYLCGSMEGWDRPKMGGGGGGASGPVHYSSRPFLPL